LRRAGAAAEQGKRRINSAAKIYPRTEVRGLLLNITTTPPGVVLPIFPFSRASEDKFHHFSVRLRRIFATGGYYRNPVNWKGLKSRNWVYALELPKTAIYRILTGMRYKMASSRSAESVVGNLVVPEIVPLTKDFQ